MRSDCFPNSLDRHKNRRKISKYSTDIKHPHTQGVPLKYPEREQVVTDPKGPEIRQLDQGVPWFSPVQE